MAKAKRIVQTAGTVELVLTITEAKVLKALTASTFNSSIAYNIRIALSTAGIFACGEDIPNWSGSITFEKESK